MEQPKPTRDNEKIQKKYAEFTGVLFYYKEQYDIGSKSRKIHCKYKIKYYNQQLTKLLKE